MKFVGMSTFGLDNNDMDAFAIVIEFLHFLTSVARGQEVVGSLLQLLFLLESTFCEVPHP